MVNFKTLLESNAAMLHGDILSLNEVLGITLPVREFEISIMGYYVAWQSLIGTTGVPEVNATSLSRSQDEVLAQLYARETIPDIRSAVSQLKTAFTSYDNALMANGGFTLSPGTSRGWCIPTLLDCFLRRIFDASAEEVAKLPETYVTEIERIVDRCFFESCASREG